MNPKSLIYKYIETLKRIKLYIMNLADPKFADSVQYLELAIRSLIAYRDSQTPYSYRPNPRKKQFPHDQEISNRCPSGKHWVNRTLKNGEPGFCRKNPQRNKN